MVVLLPAIVAWTGLATASGGTTCPDISGRYSVKGAGSARSDALVALHATQADYLSGGIELSGARDGTLSVGIKSGISDPWSTRPAAVLREGTDFECAGGWLVLTTPHKKATRKTDEGKWLEGQATTSLSRVANGELAIAVRFTGIERISLYSYESANVSIPKPGTRTTLGDTYRWPTYSDTESLAPTAPAIAEIVRDTRERLTSVVLGRVMLSGLKPDGDGVLATLRATRSDEIVAFEDRLRAAAIPYETRVAPVWSNNTYYLELLIRPAGANGGSTTRPSAFRIEQDMQRFFDVKNVTDSEDGYVVTLNIFDATPIADVVRRVQLNSILIGTMELVEESTQAGSKIRVARFKVRLR